MSQLTFSRQVRTHGQIKSYLSTAVPPVQRNSFTRFQCICTASTRFSLWTCPATGSRREPGSPARATKSFRKMDQLTSLPFWLSSLSWTVPVLTCASVGTIGEQPLLWRWAWRIRWDSRKSWLYFQVIMRRIRMKLRVSRFLCWSSGSSRTSSMFGQNGSQLLRRSLMPRSTSLK